MKQDILVPQLPESVVDAVVAAWLKQAGDAVVADEPLLELETDKVVLEVTAPMSGVLRTIIAPAGATVHSDDVLGIVQAADLDESPTSTSTITDRTSTVTQSSDNLKTPTSTTDTPPVSPAVRQQLAAHDLSANDVQGSGKKGRILKTDIDAYLQQQAQAPAAVTKPEVAQTSPQKAAHEQQHEDFQKSQAEEFIDEAYQYNQRPERRVPMTRLRQRIAERLVAVQQNSAILTTFNEVDLTEIKRMREQYKVRFERVHQSKLGFMSFFVKASTEALKRFPEVNARIDGEDIVYQGYYDIGVAVSTERGLVVPIIKNADQLSYADIEKKITDYSQRARNNRLDIEELSGGTFSISNGGVFGSMLSTPILNPPQSAILGMHKIEDRPVVNAGEIVIRPMMYLALSYDHRLIDGKTAVSFLLKIKELLEDPASLLLEL
ncbi:MAG: 2-oxoglutarate dehydrogenase complex dihydrolipoyllysine-residue succinyltransferase [bacterium]